MFEYLDKKGSSSGRDTWMRCRVFLSAAVVILPMDQNPQNPISHICRLVKAFSKKSEEK